MTDQDKATRRILLHRTLWRWHFYAGLFCVPFVLILSITGAIYLFKPQVNAWLDEPFAHLTVSGPVASPQAQAMAAVGSIPGGRLKAYELPRAPEQAVQILVTAKGETTRVWVHPQTLQVLKAVPEDDRFMQVIHDIHGELLMGKQGAILVELAGAWALIMVLTGLYLWWPRGAQGLAGVVYPRLDRGGRLFWRDLHTVTGLWISGLALFLLVTALPWTQVWGQAFKEVRRMTAPAAAPADWATAGNRAPPQDLHAEHQGMTGMAGHDHLMLGQYALLNTIVPQAQAMNLAYPALVSPPGGRARTWVAKSDSQDRPLREEHRFNAQGRPIGHSTFGDKPLLDRVVGVGVAAHEGQLFGLPNQILGLIAAFGMATLSVSGVVMWWSRRPQDGLGAPEKLDDRPLSIGLGLLALAFAVFLPVLGVSLALVIALDRLVFPFIPGLRSWLGLANPSP